MKTPSWWYVQSPGLAARILAPLGRLYAGAVAVRLRRKPIIAPIPVICIGNVVAGGSGKTPAALAVCDILMEMVPGVHFVSRGHKGRARGSLRVDPAVHSAADVGDEPLLLAAMAPTWVGCSRVQSIAHAALAGAKCVVMDDGLQNPFVAKTMSFCVIDGAVGNGNGLCIPAGPLRENLKDGLARCAAVIFIGADETGLLARLPKDKPVLRAHLVPGPEFAAMAGKNWLAFCGLGRPEKFFRFLEDQGCGLAAVTPFADHHPYTDAEIAHLKEGAAQLGAGLVTTAKDMVRIPPALRAGIAVATIRLEFEDALQVREMLKKGCALP